MRSLLLTPIMREAHGAPVDRSPTSLRPGSESAKCATYVLRMQQDGELAATPIASGDGALDAMQRDNTVVALLRSRFVGREEAWDLVACSAHVGLNDRTPCLPLSVIEPGDLLSIGDRFWMAASRWQPEVLEAPAELRNKPCPHCGGELGLAPVVQCGCGRWTHLENASAPHDKDALNCFVAAGTCGGCGRAASLEPQVFPEVPGSLADLSVADDGFDRW